MENINGLRRNVKKKVEVIVKVKREVFMIIKIIAAVVLTAAVAAAPALAQEMQMMPPPEEEVADEVVATVNGEEIHMSDVEDAAQTQMLQMQMFQINPQFGHFLQSEEGQRAMQDYRRFVLDNVIDETLLSQKAGREGIEVTQEDIDREFQEHIHQIKAQHGISEEELLQTLQQQGITSLDEYKQLFVELANLEERKLLEEAGVGEAEVEEYVQKLREEAEIEIKI